MNQLMSVLLYKQSQILEVQKEILVLRDIARRKEQHRKELARRREQRSQLLAMFAVALLVGALLGFALVNDDDARTIHWDRDEERVVIFQR